MPASARRPLPSLPSRSSCRSSRSDDAAEHVCDPAKLRGARRASGILRCDQDGDAAVALGDRGVPSSAAKDGAPPAACICAGGVCRGRGGLHDGPRRPPAQEQAEGGAWQNSGLDGRHSNSQRRPSSPRRRGRGWRACAPSHERRQRPSGCESSTPRLCGRPGPPSDAHAGWPTPLLHPAPVWTPYGGAPSHRGGREERYARSSHGPSQRPGARRLRQAPAVPQGRG